jgi:hypothetical protein
MLANIFSISLSSTDFLVSAIGLHAA